MDKNKKNAKRETNEDLSKGVPENASKTNQLSVVMKKAALDNDWLAKWFEATIADIGKEGDKVPDGAHAKNLASVKAGGVREAIQEATEEDLKVIFGEVEVSEDAKNKMAGLFEAAIDAHVAAIEIETREKYESETEKRVAEAIGAYNERFEDFTNFIAEKYLEENAVAIQSNVMLNTMVSFTEAMRKVFLEHNIDIPESKLDVVEAQQEKLKEYEDQLNDLIKENMELKAEKTLARKNEIIAKVCEGLTLNQAENFKKLAEGLEYDGDDTAFKERLNFAKSHSGKTPVDTGVIKEDLDTNENTTVKKIDPAMQRLIETAVKINKRG